MLKFTKEVLFFVRAEDPQCLEDVAEQMLEDGFDPEENDQQIWITSVSSPLEEVDADFYVDGGEIKRI